MLTVVYFDLFYFKIQSDKYTGGYMKDIVLKEAKEIGSIIKELRSEMKITQEELANFTGLSRIGVVKLEKEENDLKLSSLIKIANLLGFEIVLRRRSNK
jgi:DNA-binding XRE family transcriptional regulator